MSILKDIFAGKYCLWVFILIAVIITVINFLPGNLRNILLIIFFFVIGGLCLYNYKVCGRVHCQITGYGFLLVGILALLGILEIIDIGNILNVMILAVLIIGFGYEFLYKNKKGTCYKK